MRLSARKIEVEILINNAGFGVGMPFVNQDSEENGNSAKDNYHTTRKLSLTPFLPFLPDCDSCRYSSGMLTSSIRAKRPAESR